MREPERAAGASGTAHRVDHPGFGQLWFDCDVLVSADGDTRVVKYTAAADSPGEAALAALASRGPGGPDTPPSVAGDGIEATLQSEHG